MSNLNKLDIVKLIENSPITSLSTKFHTKLLSKVQESFTDSQQQLFVGSFYCYLNYNSKTDFVISLDSVWKWCGFSRKGFAKTLLEKHFIVNVDYKVFASAVAEAKLEPENMEKADKIKKTKNLGGAGLNKEKVLMTINTFKKFCLKASTKKADEIHDYYIKLEELLQETMNEESQELKLELENKQTLLENTENALEAEKEKVKYISKKRFYKAEKQNTIYIYKNNELNNDDNLYTIGKTIDIDKRENSYITHNQSGVVVYAKSCYNKDLLERVIHQVLDKYRVFSCSFIYYILLTNAFVC